MNELKDRIPAQRRRRVKGNLATCAVSRKVRYRDHREATRALQRLTTQAMLADELGGAHTIAVKRQYRCTTCNGWHLTSWESPTSPVTAGSQPHSGAHGLSRAA
jgi:hypothetical protein